MFDEYKNCRLCPRKCGADRYNSTGYCGMNAEIKAAKATLHKWEEPCISYKNGAGTIFFSGCNLKCVFCQNNEISIRNFGKSLTASELADIMLKVQERGADNIEFVTPTHFLPDILSALDKIRQHIHIPVVYNCGGYELPETIKMLDGYIDIYLPDIKYYSSEISKKYSLAEDYFEKASASVLEMIKQTGKIKFNDEGGMLKGTVIRHLVLPGCRHDSMKIMEWIAENTSPDTRLVSIMSQYTPFDFIPDIFPELKRRITKMEYNSVVKKAEELGIDGFTQSPSSASGDYVPFFDLSGLS